MKNKIKKSLAVAALGATALGGSLVTSQIPASAAGSCAGAGYLCFYDYGTATYGNVSGNNGYWGNFGWNDRADWFSNQGTSCTVRVYKDINGGRGRLRDHPRLHTALGQRRQLELLVLTAG